MNAAPAETAFELQPGRERWLDDHRPGGERIVPAAAIALWLLEVAGAGSQLRELRWLRPLRVPDDGTSVRIERRPRASDRLVLELHAPRPRPAGRGFGSARIASAEVEDAAPGRLATDVARCPPPLRSGTPIDLPRAAFHGPTFRGLAGPLHASEAGLDARLRFDRPRPSGLPAFGGGDARHLDVLFQAAGLFRRLRGRPREVPTAAGELACCGGPGDDGPLLLRVRRVAAGAGGGDDALDLWCGTRGGSTRIAVRRYRTAPADFLPGTRPRGAGGGA